MTLEEHTALCKRQDWVERRLAHAAYTGVSYSPPDDDWQVWLAGKQLGAAPTRIEAQDRVQEALLRRKAVG